MSLSWGSLFHFPIVCLALRDRGTTNPYLLWVQHLDNQCMIDKLHFHCYWIPKTGYLERPDISCCISSLSAVICLIETVECFRYLMPFYSETLLPQNPKSPSPSPHNLKEEPQVPPLNPKSPCPSPQNLKGCPQVPPLNPESPCPSPQNLKGCPQVPPLNPKSPSPSPQNLKVCVGRVAADPWHG